MSLSPFAPLRRSARLRCDGGAVYSSGVFRSTSARTQNAVPYAAHRCSFLTTTPPATMTCAACAIRPLWQAGHRRSAISGGAGPPDGVTSASEQDDPDESGRWSATAGVSLRLGRRIVDRDLVPRTARRVTMPERRLNGPCARCPFVDVAAGLTADDVRDLAIRGGDVGLPLRRLAFQLPTAKHRMWTWNLSSPGMAPSCAN